MSNSFRNPLGYFCAPNGAGPDYVAEHSFERFIAFGMVACHDHIDAQGTELINGDTADVYWLRKNFLDTVEMAIGFLPEMSQEAKEGSILVSISYSGDQQEGSVFIPTKDGDELCYQWNFEQLDLDDDHCLLFSLTWGEADDFAIWLRLDAIYGPDAGCPLEVKEDEHSANVKAILQHANEWNQANQGEIHMEQVNA